MGKRGKQDWDERCLPGGKQQEKNLPAIGLANTGRFAGEKSGKAYWFFLF